MQFKIYSNRFYPVMGERGEHRHRNRRTVFEETTMLNENSRERIGSFVEKAKERYPRLAALVARLAAVYYRTPVDADREATLRRYVRVPGLVVIGLSMLAVPAAAQLDQVGQALCNNGIGQILSIVFAAATLYFLFKAIFRGMSGLDKKGSKKPQTQQEGDNQLLGALYSGAAAFAPPIFAAILEIIGVSTISCFDFNVGVFGMVMPLPVSGTPLGPVIAAVSPMGAQGLSFAALAVVGYVRA
jgi:hypothetical protein